MTSSPSGRPISRKVSLETTQRSGDGPQNISVDVTHEVFEILGCLNRMLLGEPRVYMVTNNRMKSQCLFEKKHSNFMK